MRGGWRGSTPFCSIESKPKSLWHAVKFGASVRQSWRSGDESRNQVAPMTKKRYAYWCGRLVICMQSLVSICDRMTVLNHYKVQPFCQGCRDTQMAWQPTLPLWAPDSFYFQGSTRPLPFEYISCSCTLTHCKEYERLGPSLSRQTQLKQHKIQFWWFNTIVYWKPVKEWKWCLSSIVKTRESPVWWVIGSFFTSLLIIFVLRTNTGHGNTSGTSIALVIHWLYGTHWSCYWCITIDQ